MLLLVLLIVSLLPVPSARSAPPAFAAPSLTPLTTTAIGNPIATETAIFWWDRRGAQPAIYGYDLASQREFLVATPSQQAWGLASDGTTVVWTEMFSGTQRIQGYNLATRQEQTLVQSDDYLYALTHAQPVLTAGTLYYVSTAPDPAQRGLYAMHIATGMTERISPTGRDPVVAAGILLWSEYTMAGTRLLLRQLDASAPDRLIATVGGGIAYTTVTTDAVVWAPGPRDRLLLYRISTGTISQVVAGNVAYPVLQGSTLLWTGVTYIPAVVQYALQSYNLLTGVQQTVVATTTIPLQSRALLAPDSLLFTAQMQPTYADVTLYRATHHPGAAPLTLPQMQAGSAMPATARPDAQIVIRDNETVFREGNAPDAPIWTPKGVQFIPPSIDWGVSAVAFSKVYEKADDPGRRRLFETWLTRAQQLNVTMLRIFIDLPGGNYPVNGQTTARLRTLYRFAYAADQQGMRLGLAFGSTGLAQFLNPSGLTKIRFRDDTAKKTWLEALVRCFNGEGVDDPAYPSDPNSSNPDERNNSCTIPGLEAQPNLLHTLDYINLDNEINNHCAESPLDWRLDDADGKKPRNCYHYVSGNENSGRSYAEAATQWVYDIRQELQSIYGRLALPTGFQPLLLTVGKSTEVFEPTSFDGQRYYSEPALAVNEFLTPYAIEVTDSQGQTRTENRRLIDLVDFPSPHRYSPDAPTPTDPNNEHAIITIRDTIRRGTTQPLLLEEYGTPTDPLARDGRWVDGDRPRAISENDPQYCRRSDKVLTAECRDTAPGLIQRVINDMRLGYAGYSAFMLVDALEDNQGGDPPENCSILPSDIFTGLYAIGRGNPRDGCRGTINNTLGQLKNTGYRVCVFYQGREACYVSYLPLLRR